MSMQRDHYSEIDKTQDRRPTPGIHTGPVPEIGTACQARVKRERDHILERAGILISDKRDAEYGSARDNFTNVGRLWAVTFGLEEAIPPHLVAIALAQLKQARLLTRPNHTDSWDDGTGYMALGGDIAKEIADEQRAYEQRQTTTPEPHIGDPIAGK